MTDNKERLIKKALAIMEKRAKDPNRTIAQRSAYDSAIIMICYALAESEENLNQFDY